MRMRTIRRLEAKVRRSEAEQRLRDIQRAELYKQIGSPDKKTAKDLVGVDFGFTEETDGCVASPIVSR
jgi:hypothetical protein